MWIKILVLTIIAAFITYQEYQIAELRDNVNIVYNQQLLKDRRNKMEETDFVRTAKNSILILRCTDSTTTTDPLKNWVGTAVKSHPEYILTVFHNISVKSNGYKRTYPLTCILTQENIKMAEFKIMSQAEAESFQVAKRDIAIIPVTYTKEGQKLPNLVPEKVKVATGDVVALLSSPAKFNLDAIVTFGVVLANNLKYSMLEEYKILWENAISSDVIASGGSSGGAILYFGREAKFIGLHVGNNRQTGIYLAHYHLTFDEAFFKRFKELP